MISFFEQLKRRNVFRTVATYGALSWVLLQVVDLSSPIFGLPDELMRYLTIVLAIGLVPVAIVSWIYELTPEGIQREEQAPADTPYRRHIAHRMNITVVALLVVAVGLLLLDRFFVAEPAAEPAGSQAAMPADGHIRSIAVLPFADFSPGGDHAYLGDGIADTVLQMLADVDGLRVAARTSSFLFRGQDVDIATIGRQLSVDSVLEGSVQVVGDRIRVIAQLIRTADQDHVWSKTFDRTMDDIFAIQDEIANAVAAEFAADNDAPPEMLASSRTSPEVYALLLRARHLSQQRTAPAIAEAIELLTRAIGQDPAYAAAHSELALALYRDTGWGTATLEELKPRIRQEIDTALQLDPQDAGAFAIRAFMWPYPEQSDKLLADLERSLELDPSNVEVMLWLADELENQNRLGERSQWVVKAYETDPLNVEVRSRWAQRLLVEGGDADRAIAFARETVDLGLNPPRALKTLADLYVVSGRLGGVAPVYFEAARADPGSPQPYARLGGWLAFLGERELSDRWYEQAFELKPELRQSSALFIRASRGEAEQLLQEKEQKLRENPESFEAMNDVQEIAAALDRCDRAIEVGERVIETQPPEVLQKNIYWGMFTYWSLSLCHRRLGHDEEAEYFAQKYFPLSQARVRGPTASEFDRIFINVFDGLVEQDYDKVAYALENLPLAKPLNYANLKYRALYQPALQNERVRRWYDQIEAQIAQARAELQNIEDPAFREPGLLRPAG